MKIKKIYCNGCSHSAGGGLEVDRLLDDVLLVRDYYKQKYNVWWDSQLETTYIKYASDVIKCEYVNEAASGGGSERVIRMAYDFVKKNYKIKDELFLVLEFPSLGRIDLYSKQLNDYIIGNINFVNNDYSDDSINNIYGTRGYYIKEYDKDNSYLIKPLKSYYENFLSRKAEFIKVGRQINTFLSYLSYHQIKFIFFTGEFSTLIESHFKENNLLKLKLGNTIIEDLHEFAIETKSTIAEECDFLTTDLHPGYFSHQNFGNLLGNYIIENYEIF